MGFQQDKFIENEAFWAADKQRIDEATARKSNAKRVFSHQDKLKRMWLRHMENKKAPSAQFYLPGPGQYESKHYIRDDHSFPVHKF